MLRMRMTRIEMKRLGGALLLLSACLLVLTIGYTSQLGGAASRGPRSRLLPRHATQKEVHARYIRHEVDPMQIDLRENYERRRLLASADFRPKFRPRSEALDYHRGRPTAAPPTSSTQEFLPLSPDTSAPEFDLSCDTCALVSNSGQMLYSQAGQSIDSAQCVFRMNVAPTHGYELDVGQRTTVRVISHNSIKSLVTNASAVLDSERHLKNILFHGPDYKYSINSVSDSIQGLQRDYPDVNFYRTSPLLEDRAGKEFASHARNSIKSTSSSLSTGLYALMVMKDMCNSVTVYGMIPENYCSEHPESTVPYNYFDNSNHASIPECIMYRYYQEADLDQRLKTERGLFRTWAQDNRITFQNPSW